MCYEPYSQLRSGVAVEALASLAMAEGLAPGTTVDLSMPGFADPQHQTEPLPTLPRATSSSIPNPSHPNSQGSDRWSHIPDVPLTLEDERLRLEAAELTGIDAASLPEAAVLNKVIRWLFLLLDPNRVGEVAASDLISACAAYDDRVPVEGIKNTIATVDGQDTLTEKSFYWWIVLMFGDCAQDAFLCGLSDFGAAARRAIRGVKS